MRSSRLVCEKVSKALRRGGDRLVDVGGGAERDAREGLFGGGIDDVEGLGRDRVHPFAVDIELKTFLHSLDSLL